MPRVDAPLYRHRVDWTGWGLVVIVIVTVVVGVGVCGVAMSPCELNDRLAMLRGEGKLWGDGGECITGLSLVGRLDTALGTQESGDAKENLARVAQYEEHRDLKHDNKHAHPCLCAHHCSWSWYRC